MRHLSVIRYCSGDRFWYSEAILVCKQLGYETGDPVHDWGGGTGPIIMVGSCMYVCLRAAVSVCMF
jgi:hypothetical protein